MPLITVGLVLSPEHFNMIPLKHPGHSLSIKVLFPFSITHSITHIWNWDSAPCPWCKESPRIEFLVDSSVINIRKCCSDAHSSLKTTWYDQRWSIHLKVCQISKAVGSDIPYRGILGTKCLWWYNSRDILQASDQAQSCCSSICRDCIAGQHAGMSTAGVNAPKVRRNVLYLVSSH